MNESIKTIALIDIIFIVILMISSTLDGVFSDLVYYLAFLVPIFIGFYKSLELKRNREEQRGLAEDSDSL